MGNTNNSKQDFSASRVEHWNKLLDLPSCSLIQSLSYRKWIKWQRSISGFGDFADFTICRESRLRHGVLVKPDTTHGRYLIAGFKSKSELLVMEKQRWFIGTFELPRAPPPDFEDPHWFRRSNHNRNRKECSAVAYHDNLLVVQVNTNRYYLSPRFYILDLSQNRVVGHFLIFYHCRRWYECYISPNKTHVLLRPDNFSRVVALPDNYLLENVTIDHSHSNMSVGVIPPTLRAHVMCFNSLAGDDVMIVAFHKNLEVRKIDSWEVVRSVQNLDLPTGIQQVKSSPMGDFLVVRCVHPVHSKEFNINFVAVLNYKQFDILFKIDVKGCYWPVSEVINLQVFPHFSPSEASVAIMKNGTYTRKVITYKLPIRRCNLQYLCRRTILHLVRLKDIDQLPLPTKVMNFLLAKPGFTKIGAE